MKEKWVLLSSFTGTCGRRLWRQFSGYLWSALREHYLFALGRWTSFLTDLKKKKKRTRFHLFESHYRKSGTQRTLCELTMWPLNWLRFKRKIQSNEKASLVYMLPIIFIQTKALLKWREALLILFWCFDFWHHTFVVHFQFYTCYSLLPNCNIT